VLWGGVVGALLFALAVWLAQTARHRARTLQREMAERQQAQAALARTQGQLLEASRQAGMAEVATSVLHNVGNVLNSVNISAALVAGQVRQSKAGHLVKAAALLQAHAAKLADDPKAQQLPGYLTQLAQHLAAERAQLLRELDSLTQNIEHIKQIVTMQQRHAKTGGVIETVPVAELVEDALRLNAGALARHGVEIVRDHGAAPPVTVDRHKVLQILVNLIRNAKYALDESGRADKRLTLRIGKNGEPFVKIEVADNGVGIPPENLTRIFQHGFTTRKDGHGFGLHSGALAAQEMGGTLTVHSDGPGQGATFTLALPCQPPEPRP
jgi:signal transduction histidine kinase